MTMIELENAQMWSRLVLIVHEGVSREDFDRWLALVGEGKDDIRIYKGVALASIVMLPSEVTALRERIGYAASADQPAP